MLRKTKTMGKGIGFKRLRRALFSEYSGIQYGVIQTTKTIYLYMHYRIGEMSSVFSKSFSCCGNMKL